MKISFLIILTCLFSIELFAQVDPCGTSKITEQLRATYPDYDKQVDIFNQKINEAAEKR